MDSVTNQVQANARKVIVLQVGVAAAIAIAFWISESSWHSLSAAFGVGVSILSALLLRRGVVRANEMVQADPKKGMAILYFGAVQRFVMIAALFALGLVVFKVDPLAAVVGFGSAQFAYAIVMRRTAHPARR